MLDDWFPDDIPYRHSRVETVLWILKDHLHFRALEPQLFRTQLSDFNSSEYNISGSRRIKL